MLLLVGPTAVGKTALALKAAEMLDAEIVSADSRQVYRYMDIGTAKPTPEELRRVPHHFIDVRTPDQYYSAGEYGREARARIEEILRRRRVIVAGGSGFYIQALVDGLFAPPHSDPQLKEKWRKRIAEEGRDAVFEVLRRVDPETAARLHPNDTQRVVRALEVWELTGKPVSAFRRGEEQPADFKPIFIGLTRSPDSLRRCIEERVDAMMGAGLIQEAERLRRMGYSPTLNALRTVGYSEAFDCLDGLIDEAEARRRIVLHTRQYAKRQLTWFRRDPRIRWLDADALSTAELLDHIIAAVRSEEDKGRS